jgi:NAD+ kinase
VPRRQATRVGVIIKPNEPRAAGVVATFAEWASLHHIELLVDDHLTDLPSPATSASVETIAEKSEVLIVLGGDGTIIATARLVAGRGIPVLGINLGWLGYLTEFSIDDTQKALESLIRCDYLVDSRTMLDWSIERDGVEVGRGLVLNDVVLNKSALARVIEIDCRIGGLEVTTYRGDGLIVSTPTGSTAYNLSAGGPIIYPDTKAIAISPICPHTLTNRPVVLPDSVEIDLQLITREQDVMLTSDGQIGLPLTGCDLVRIKKSDKTFDIIRPTDRDYFQILRDKLKWSGSAAR